MGVETSVGLETKRRVTNQAGFTAPGKAQMPAGLDWQAFSAAYFPGRRRHDLKSLNAYGAYRRSEAGDALSSEEPAEPGPAGPTALQGWEDEGGAALGVGAP